MLNFTFLKSLKAFMFIFSIAFSVFLHANNDTLFYEAENTYLIGGAYKQERVGASNDTTVSGLNYLGKGIEFIALEDANQIYLGYGTYNIGT